MKVVNRNNFVQHTLYEVIRPEKTIDPDNYKKLFGHLTFDILDPNRVYYYAAFDAWATYELYKFQLPFLDGVSEPCIEQDLVDTGYLFTQIEAPLTEAVASMEDTGVSIDIEYAHELSVKYTEQIDACFIELNELVSNLINPYLPQFKQEQPELYVITSYSIHYTKLYDYLG